MARLIEIQDVRECPSPLTVQPGDVLLVHAPGGRRLSDDSAVELVGPLLSAVLADNGTILTPEGPPNAILLLAHRPGEAFIEVVTGDPWVAPQATILHIVVILN